MRKIICPINRNTKEDFECIDCPIKDDCPQDIYDDAATECLKIWAEADKKISKIMRRKRYEISKSDMA
jgi:predicted nucleic acid-binding Zn ribbon protein